MQIKIGVFGRKEWIERLQHYTKEDTELEVIPFVFDKAKETKDLIEESYMCDIYLFIGTLPYLYAKEKIDKKRLPAVYVDFDEYMVLSSFYRLKQDHGQRLNRFSVDILNREYVSAILEELHIKNRDIYTHSYLHEETIDIDKIIAYHTRLWEQGKIDYVLTSIAEVKQSLSNLGIQTYLMEIPKRNILEAIQKAKSIIHFNKSTSAQIVAGYVRIKEFQSLGELSRQDTSLQLHRLLLKFAHQTYASVLPHRDDLFVLFGTRGMLDHITNHYRDFPLLKEMEQSLNVSVEIGFGLGMTVREADDHAMKALEVCKGTDESSCYIVNDREEIIGPLGVEKHVSASKLYHALIHKARLNNELSYNFIDFIKLRNNEPFSSADIATYYSVTKRSAERTIHKLRKGRVIKEVGQEKPYLQGRPRKLFAINL